MKPNKLSDKLLAMLNHERLNNNISQFEIDYALAYLHANMSVSCYAIMHGELPKKKARRKIIKQYSKFLAELVELNQYEVEDRRD